MSHSVTIIYTRSLVRRALNAFMLKRLGKSTFVVFALMIVFLAWKAIGGSWTSGLTWVAAALAFGAAFLVVIYFARFRAAEGFFDQGDEPTATIVFTEEGVRTESHVGSVDLKWKVFEEILKFPEVWLLVYAKSGYMTLPVVQLTPECRAFLEEQVRTKGRKA